MPAPRRTPTGLQLTRSARAIERAFNDELTAAGGSAPVWTILLALKSGSARNQREIAARAGIQGATLTHHLDALEGRGLVTRRRDPDNRRVHIVELTADGEALFRSLRDAAGRFDRRLRRGVAAADLDRFHLMLQTLAGNVGEGPDR